jgi:hypothetical protein
MRTGSKSTAVQHSRGGYGIAPCVYFLFVVLFCNLNKFFVYGGAI